MQEEIITELLGNYAYDLSIPINAPIGEWTGTIFSTDEDVKSSFRFSVQDESSGSAAGSSNDDDAILLISNEMVDVKIESIQEVSMHINDESADIKIESDSVNLSYEEIEVELKSK